MTTVARNINHRQNLQFFSAYLIPEIKLTISSNKLKLKPFNGSF